MQRSAISKRVRFEVFKRDRFICAYCGAHPPQVILEVDHIIPVSTGGLNDIDNLITSCFACNRGKADKSLNDIPQALNERLSEIKEREAQIAGYEAIMRESRGRLDDDAQEVLDHI
jgi:5-methylcytosine-specific restriction endonuclease McrA